MKDIRICDNGNIDLTKSLCEKYKLGIEVQGFYDPTIDVESLKKDCRVAFNSISGGRSLHAPFFELNLGTKMKGVRDTTMNMFNFAYSIAKDLGCTEMIVHNGYIPGTSWYSGWVNRAVTFWQEFFADKDDSITICIENQFENDSELIKMEIDAVNDPRLKACLDIGHVNANSSVPVSEWIEDLGTRIGYLHLHNNHGKRTIRGYNGDDEHLGLSTGTIDIENVFLMLEQHCPDAIWAIETKVDYLEDSVKLLQNLNYLD